MNTYNLSFPGKIVFGAGTCASLSKELPADSRVLLVTGKHAKKSGLLESLNEILKDFDVTSVCGISAEPPLAEVDKLLKIGRENDVNAVVAIGGGSVMDAAKAAAAIIPLEGMTSDYFFGHKTIPGKGLFFAALPTTSGTGSEITPNSVLTDTETDIKKSIRHATMIADVAIIDPELTYSCPSALTAASGLDAFTQAIESYISCGANNVSRALAAKSAKFLFENLPRIYSNPEDKDARSGMAEGSMIGAMAFTQSGLGAVHGIGHPIGSKLHVPHGLCCAILLPVILRWNQPECASQLDTLGHICDCGNGENFISEVEKLCRKLDVPSNFKDFGLTEQHFDFIIKNCRSNSMTKNPRELSDEDVAKILESLT
jgi:alcohol dehydrogenase class IV